MCRSCGSIVGAGQKECAVCGTLVSSNARLTHKSEEIVADGETLRFAKAVLNRPYKFTIVLLVANVFVFLLMWQTSGQPFSVLRPLPHEVLIPFGAKVNLYIQAGHEWWRFVAPIFLHVNFLHLMVNMYSLWILGPYVEKLYGSAKFVVFWILTGVAGVVASYLTVRPGLSVGPIARFIFKTNDEPSAGASGALFGLVGVLFVFGIKYRHELPEGFKRAFGTGLLPMILMNLFIGYMLRGIIDNAAHLGGLISGALLAVVIDYRRPGEKSRIALTWRVGKIAAIVLVVVSFLKTAQHFKDPLQVSLPDPSLNLMDDRTMNFVSYAKAMNNAQESFYSMVKDHDNSQADAAIEALESTPPLDPGADDLKEQLKALLSRARTSNNAAADSTKSNARSVQQRESQLTHDFIAWSKQYNVWLKNTGRTYGLVETTQAQSAK